MTATAAVIGYGTSFSIYGGSTYTAVAEVTNITWPGYTRDAVDATNMASPNEFREFIPGLMDAGEVTIEMNFIPSASDVILAALTAGTGQFKIAAASGVNIVFSAIVTAFTPQAPLEDKMSASATFKITGKPVWAAS